MEQDHIKQLEDLSNKIKEGVVVLHGGKIQYRNADTWYPFRQNSYFHYLTSWPEPDAHAIIRIKKGKPELFLFVLEKNEEMETWDGKRIGVEGAEKEYGATKAYPNTEYQKRFEDLVKGHSNIYIDYSSKDFEELDKKLIEKSLPYDQRGAGFSNANIFPILPILSEMRLVKKEEELEKLTKACEITTEGHIAAMAYAKPGLYEYEVAAEMESVFYKLGAERLGYPSIVAGGLNSCVLHYSTNRDVLKGGDLLLIDAAAEYNMYSSDVTRTFPVSDSFSREQKDVYIEVLSAQEKGIELVTKGSSMEKVHEETVKNISKSIVDLGLVPYGIEETVSMMHYFEFFMHGTGHWLGLDVHDAGSIDIDKKPRKFEEGMVTTIEPGIYIKENKPIVDFPILERDPKKIKERRRDLGMEEATKVEKKEVDEAKKVSHKIPEELLGIGIRIEDDIVCTEKGPLNLTEAVPREVDEIEEICRSRPDPQK